MSYFEVKNGILEGKRIDLAPPKISFGRLNTCSVNLEDQNVSRVHAECHIFDNDIVALVDLGSSNGTFVNNLPISRIFLFDGDEIRMGETLLVYHETELSAKTEKEKIIQFIPDKSKIIKSFTTVTPKETFLMEPEDLSIEVLKETYLKLRTLNKLLIEISKCRSSEDAFNAIGKALLISTPAIRISFFIIDKSTDKPKLVNSNISDEYLNLNVEEYPLNEEIFNTLLSEKAPVMFFYQKDKEFNESADPHKICRCIASPIIRLDELLAIVVADIPVDNKSFSKSDIELLSGISSHLGEILARLTEFEKLKKKNLSLEKHIFGDLTIVCKNKKMVKILESLNQIAESDSSVLITGESGTGKELIAKAIHFFSNRRNKPIVCINCASIPETLLESELFGYEKGAFTGAVSKKLGKFEIANEGTIFLDEIGDIPLSAQAKLLRILQEGEFERLGGNQTIKINIRLICATNKNLTSEIKEKRFREDLFYRINVVKIELPPLRERPEDIPILADYFLKSLKTRIPTPAVKFHNEVIRLFLNYPWFGNIRELHNVIERALVFCKSEEVFPEHLPIEILETSYPDKITNSEKCSNDSETKYDDLSLYEAEKRHILKILALAEGNKQKAAELLKISRTTLYEKIKQFEK